ncbi:hypothetical protein PG991_015220 [Apiospora marii]|uniref:Uncharacterized protein n=1 Tax=Apiospora marii TaxID=335849 RepID=A0ABR1R0Y9_9PEZI
MFYQRKLPKRTTPSTKESYDPVSPFPASPSSALFSLSQPPIIHFLLTLPQQNIPPPLLLPQVGPGPKVDPVVVHQDLDEVVVGRVGHLLVVVGPDQVLEPLGLPRDAVQPLLLRGFEETRDESPRGRGPGGETGRGGGRRRGSSVDAHFGSGFGVVGHYVLCMV